MELFLETSSEVTYRPTLPWEYRNCKWMVSPGQVVSDPETSRVCGDLGQGEYDGITGVIWCGEVSGLGGGYMSCVGEEGEGGWTSI